MKKITLDGEKLYIASMLIGVWGFFTFEFGNWYGHGQGLREGAQRAMDTILCSSELVIYRDASGIMIQYVNPKRLPLCEKKL